VRGFGREALESAKVRGFGQHRCDDSVYSKGERIWSVFLLKVRIFGQKLLLFPMLVIDTVKADAKMAI
jgi:hypothetical protein